CRLVVLRLARVNVIASGFGQVDFACRCLDLHAALRHLADMDVDATLRHFDTRSAIVECGDVDLGAGVKACFRGSNLEFSAGIGCSPEGIARSYRHVEFGLVPLILIGGMCGDGALHEAQAPDPRWWIG